MTDEELHGPELETAHTPPFFGQAKTAFRKAGAGAVAAGAVMGGFVAYALTGG